MLNLITKNIYLLKGIISLNSQVSISSGNSCREILQNATITHPQSPVTNNTLSKASCILPILQNSTIAIISTLQAHSAPGLWSTPPNQILRCCTALTSNKSTRQLMMMQTWPPEKEMDWPAPATKWLHSSTPLA